MEVIQIINDGSGTSNPWGGFFSFDGGINQGQIFQDIVLAPFEPQPIAPQYYIVDADGSFLPIVDGNNFTFIAPEADDEIPSHKLDHMYAKKPREPGTELVKPTRRRSKKKELMTSHYYVHEMIDESPPKINIIRSRHAMTPPGHSRPKILTSPPKMLSTFPSTNMLSNSSYYGYNNSTVGKSNLKTKVEEIPEAVVLDDYDEFNAPSPGAVVTVCDGVEMDPIVVSARSLKSSKKVTYHISSGLSPSYIENRNSSLDSIGEPDDDSELFLDFPIEESEEVDTTIDVDFNEIHMNSNNGIDLLRSTPITYFHHNNETDDVEFVVAEHELTDHEDKYESPIHKSESEGETESADSPQSPNCTRKRGRPVKVQSNVLLGDDELTASTSYLDIARPKPRGKDDANQNFQVLAPTRRSTRPVKAPSRLDDIEDVSSAKRKRR